MTRSSPNGEPAQQPHQRTNKEAPPERGLLLLKNRLFSAFNATLDLVYPRVCSACGRVGAGWCDSCTSQLKAVPIKPHKINIDGVTVIASGPHEGLLQEAVHALKYDDVQELSILLVRRMHRILTAARMQADIIVPIPLHRHRLDERGYNQAQLLAQALSTLTGIPVDSDSVQRVRFTRSQVGLNASERRENVKDAFIAASGHFTGRTVLLVDDVCTTGATLAACAQVLHQAGAVRVHAMTITAAT